jgi:general secretion pathway protein K
MNLRPRSGSPRRGFALIAALALLVMISVVALELSATARPRRLAAAAAAEQAAAVEVATAGIEQAHALLVRLEPRSPGRLSRGITRASDPWSPAVGMVIGPARLGAFTYRIELRDAYARLPLNGVSEDHLRRLLLALRVDSRRADRLAQAIADWRDFDQFRRANGAERSNYLRAGAPVLPDDGPFADVASLRFVLGMSDSLVAALASYLTVMGGGGVNLNTAPRPVLLALPGMTEESASLLLRERAAGRRVTDLTRFIEMLPSGARQQLRTALPMLRNIATFETREMQVTSEAWQAGGIARVRVDAIISRDAEGRVIWRRVSP